MITRDNYEEFFLLYVDNELSPAERQTVEIFVGENSDLEEEWTALLECKLKPENDSIFKDRDSLLRIPFIAGRELNEDNCEAWFISYIDGELDGEGRQRVEQYARRHPEKAKVLGLLRQTVSTPDPAIVFPDKQMLYKKEGERKVIPLRSRLLQMASAAAVIFAIGLLLFRYGASGPLAFLKNSRTGDTGITKKADTGTHQTEKKEIQSVTPGSADPLYTGSTGSKNQEAGTEKTQGNKQENKEKTKEGIAVTTAKPSFVNPEGSVVAGEAEKKRGQPIKDLAVADNNRKDKVIKPPVLIEPVDEKNKSQADFVEGAKIARIESGLPGTVSAFAYPIKNPAPTDQGKSGKDFATQALLNPSGTQAEEDLAMEPATPKKNKMRGIFRRVSRVFEKTSSLDDPDADNGKHGVLIGAFQVALK
ncbi:anti-sigma factor family protein [Flavitalea flava]